MSTATLEAVGKLMASAKILYELGRPSAASEMETMARGIYGDITADPSEPVAQWYTVEESTEYLREKGFSRETAEHLGQWMALNLQKAFESGYLKGRKDAEVAA